MNQNRINMLRFKRKQYERKVKPFSKAVVAVALIDLFLAVNDCRTVGSFFLIFSSSMKIRPIFALDHYCMNINKGTAEICPFYESLTKMDKENFDWYGCPCYEKNIFESKGSNGLNSRIFEGNKSARKLPLGTQEFIKFMTLEKLNENDEVGAAVELSECSVLDEDDSKNEKEIGRSKIFEVNDTLLNMITTSFSNELVFKMPCIQKILKTIKKENSDDDKSSQPHSLFVKFDLKAHKSVQNIIKKNDSINYIMYMYPWLTMFRIHKYIPRGFTKFFIIVSVYVWMWGSMMALMLLQGMTRGSRTCVKFWMLFNILYSFLMFMIDDWITGNTNIHKSGYFCWKFIFYSIYKPFSIWVVGEWVLAKDFDRVNNIRNHVNSNSNTNSRIVLVRIEENSNDEEFIESPEHDLFQPKPDERHFETEQRF